MRQRGTGRSRSVGRRLTGIVLVLVSLSNGWGPPAAFSATTQRRFASPEEAAEALVDAFRSGDEKAVMAILGNEGKAVVSSGDPVADRRARERFVSAYDERHRLDAGGGIRVAMVVADSPAALVRLGSGDVILSVDGRPASFLHVADTSAYLRAHAGQRVSLSVMRANGSTGTMSP